MSVLRLERGDGRGPGSRVTAQPADDQATWSPAGVLVVEQPGRVAVRVAKCRHRGVVGEVGVHPGQPLRLGVPGDDLVLRGWMLHDQRHQRDLAHRQAVVAARSPRPGSARPPRARPPRWCPPAPSAGRRWPVVSSPRHGTALPPPDPGCPRDESSYDTVARELGAVIIGYWDPEVAGTAGCCAHTLTGSRPLGQQLGRDQSAKALALVLHREIRHIDARQVPGLDGR